MSDSPRVLVYTTQYCGFCVAAKRLLEARAVPFREVDLSGDPELREQIRDRWNWMTVPVIVADGDLIGGYTELAALDQDGGLGHLR
jgi:glutaredoxin 3